jgi:protein TonB
MRQHQNKASLLELVFEGRNKSYGAYELRRDYSNRMGLALGIMLSALLGFCFWMNFRASHNENKSTSTEDRTWMKITAVEVKVPEPEPPKQSIKAVKPAQPDIATQKFTSTIDIKSHVKDPMPPNTDLTTAAISTITRVGKDPGNIVRPLGPIEPIQTSDGSGTGTPFAADERQPEFPGGEWALRDYLASHLLTPSSLEEGERRMVRVRFTVLPDGRVDGWIIESSGGAEFDREVLRVCKRMPRWIPGSQNGQRVAVQYVLPVTFLSTGS